MPVPTAKHIPLEWKPEVFKQGVGEALEEARALVPLLDNMRNSDTLSPDDRSPIRLEGLRNADRTDTPVALARKLRDVEALLEMASYLDSEGALSFSHRRHTEAEVRAAVLEALAQLEALHESL